MSNNKLFLSILLFLFIHCSINPKISHGRVVSKHKHGKQSIPKQLTINMTQKYNSEQQFMKWVNFVGSLKHTIFKSAKNKIFPSYTLIVSKNPIAGDFTTIQDAIDSLPPINLVRVVIKVKAGIYE